MYAYINYIKHGPTYMDKWLIHDNTKRHTDSHNVYSSHAD